MNDIVERLRTTRMYESQFQSVSRVPDFCKKAAKEIERLRADNANLRKRLKLWEPPLGMPDGTIAGANYFSNLDTTDDKKHTEKSEAASSRDEN